MNQSYSDEDIAQVSLIFPGVDQEDIQQDLLNTNSVELTINRILDGSVRHHFNTIFDTTRYRLSRVFDSRLRHQPFRTTPPDLDIFPAATPISKSRIFSDRGSHLLYFYLTYRFLHLYSQILF
jgi:hypothetical protein